MISIDLLIYVFILSLTPIFIDVIKTIWHRKANYDCSKCKDSTCPYHHCKRMREKLNDKDK